ncbi:Similar to hypothetical protein AKAW_00622 [Aspergillus kawachii IFO 4308]; acc. no. GAA82507 [Pyronema omphalodes CBS 100304]|uniref:Uncharacterized protein n=1 Tax=Pyronema omphalodes (strain CBS 100304) TaxID=1076935 RepID=U4KXU8_PYROM|nr:Similar to hypothetical protein AKAW_00622 [Aspergillus kawachii IFO 4308]; acc. no. GAA82507 [Pyronema omphalodes CBS 100304]
MGIERLDSTRNRMSPRAIFFDRNWKEIAPTEKQTPEGREALAKICGVPSNLLCVGKKPDVAASVILKHAGKRRTYKHEDRVYSLMGMLGVRMRADYGEGQAKAFSRLFEYIIRTTGDISIFNWTGSYSGSPITGRSMYCTDFNGFSRNHTANDLAKPASALSAIKLDHFGLHARFDICEMEVIVEGDNKRTLDAVYRLERTLKAGQHGTSNTDCFCECELIFRNKFRVNISVLCPLSSLRGVLEYATNKSPGRTVSWVMARFSGVADSNWFLCELKQDSHVENDGIFADLMRNTTMSSDSSARRQSIVDPGSLMQYLESSGLLGRRLATSEFPQDKLPQARKDRQFIRNVYMWVE